MEALPGVVGRRRTSPVIVWGHAPPPIVMGVPTRRCTARGSPRRPSFWRAEGRPAFVLVVWAPPVVIWPWGPQSLSWGRSEADSAVRGEFFTNLFVKKITNEKKFSFKIQVGRWTEDGGVGGVNEDGAVEEGIGW